MFANAFHFSGKLLPSCVDRIYNSNVTGCLSYLTILHYKVLQDAWQYVIFAKMTQYCYSPDSKVFLKSTWTVIYGAKVGMDDIFNTLSRAYTKNPLDWHNFNTWPSQAIYLPCTCSNTLFMVSRNNSTFYIHKLIILASFVNLY